MHVFVTGATGFVGTSVVRNLLAAGHSVTGLARSDASAAKLTAAGGSALRGDLTETEKLAAASREADGVIHCGFIHDFSNFMHSVEVDKQAIGAMGSALSGTGKPMLVTSGIGLLRPGQVGTETDEAGGGHPRLSEAAAMPFADAGVRIGIVRLPPSVHGDGDHGFIPIIIGLAREHGRSAYTGDGANRWPAVHVEDAGRLYLKALEKGEAGQRHHALGDTGIPFREIATVIGRKLDLPVASLTGDEAGAHFGWMANFAALDVPASCELTEQSLGWKATGPGLIDDMENGTYF